MLKIANTFCFRFKICIALLTSCVERMRVGIYMFLIYFNIVVELMVAK